MMAWPRSISSVRLLNACASARGIEITRDVRFAAGRRGLLDIYAPIDAQSAPLAMFFYGGGWEAGCKVDYRFVALAMARRGIVTAVPDYRLYPDVRFPDFIDDGARAVRWMRRNAAEFGADRRLIFLIGHSAGAYIAAMLALDRTRLDADSRAAVAGMVGIAGPYDFLPLQSDALKRIFAPAGGDLSSSQPIRYARADAPPMLLLSGLADKTVHPGNSRRLASRLRALGGHAETRFYRGIGHAAVIGAFSPVLRPLVPTLSDTIVFIRRRSESVRPRLGTPLFYQPSRLE
jgi:acetyl esterase/lipase